MKKHFTFLFILLMSAGSLIAQLRPDIIYYNFNDTGTKVPNRASAPPAGADTATLMGADSQGDTGQCGGALIGTGNASNVDYVNTGWQTKLTGSWTISFWTANITPSATLFYIFGDPNAGSLRCFTNGVAGSGNWILRGPVTDVLASGGATVAPHVTTFVYDSIAGNIYAYVDGTLVNTVAQSPLSISSTGTFVLGYSSNVELPSGGLMDEFRIYGRALSQPEVAQLMDLTNKDSSSVAACNSYKAPSGKVYTSSGSDTAMLTNASGCDSMVITKITINPLPTISITGKDTIMQGSADTLTASGGSSYVWTSGSNSDTTIVSPDSTQTYMVTVTDTNGCSDSASFTVVVNLTASVAALNSLSSSTSLYPNPVINTLNLDFKVSAPAQGKIVLMDASGQILNTTSQMLSNGKRVQMNVSNLASGMYFVKVFAGNQMQVIKFIKQ